MKKGLRDFKLFLDLPQNDSILNYSLLYNSDLLKTSQLFIAFFEQILLTYKISFRSPPKCLGHNFTRLEMSRLLNLKNTSGAKEEIFES